MQLVGASLAVARVDVEFDQERNHRWAGHDGAIPLQEPVDEVAPLSRCMTEVELQAPWADLQRLEARPDGR